MLTKIKNYFAYRSIVMAHEKELAGPAYALRVDLLGRMYTVINMPETLSGYTTDPDMVANIVTRYVASTSRYLYDIGLYELVRVYAPQKINERNYLVVFSYQHMDPRIVGMVVKYGVVAIASILALWGVLHVLSSI